jgi:hypothetical protein
VAEAVTAEATEAAMAMAQTIPVMELLVRQDFAAVALEVGWL